MGFDGGDAKVFFGGKDEGFGALQVVQQHRGTLVAQQLDIGACSGLALGHVGAVANHDELLIGQVPEGLHHGHHFFVRDHARGGEVKLAFGGAGRGGHKEVGVNRGVDDDRVAAVGFVDAPGDVVRDGDELVDAVGGAHVPEPYFVQQPAGGPGFGATHQPCGLQVLVLQVPCVADGGVAHAQVQLVGRGEHAFGHGVRAGKDEVVAREVELLDGQGHEGQVAAVAGAGARQLLDEGGAGCFALQKAALALG